MTTCARSPLPDLPQMELFPELSSEVRPAKTSPAPTPRAAASKEPGRASSSKPSASSERSALVGSLLRTALTSELGALTGCSVSWRTSATPAGRSWSVATTSAPTMSGSGLGSSAATSPSFHTPTTKANFAAPSMQKWESCKPWAIIAEGAMLPPPMASDGMKDGAGGGAGSTYPFRKILATPRKSDADRGFRGDVLAQLQNQNNRHAGMMSTPRASDMKAGGHGDVGRMGTVRHQLQVANETEPAPDKWAYARQIAALLSSTGLTGPSMTLPVTYGWMMGYPPGWLTLALRSAVLAGRLPQVSSSKPSATRSSRKSPKPSGEQS